MKNTINKIMIRIQHECHENNGSSFSFTLDGILFPQTFTKTYMSKKGLLSYKWVYHSTTNDTAYTHEEIEALFSQLPPGVTYTKETILLKALPSSAENQNTASEKLENKYTIFVAESYSKSIMLEFTNNNYVVSKEFDSATIEQSEKFKNRIKLLHPEIIEPLFKNGLQKCGILTKDGFTDYDKFSFSLKEVEMKPLEDLSQMLGLAFALAEYGSSFIEADSVYFITSSLSDICFLCQKRICKGQPKLNSW